MKTVYQLLLFSFFVFFSVAAFAQQYNVTGVVVNKKGELLKGATVFIGGSERVMPTDENGRFNFGNVEPGTFQLSVQMIGYAPLTRNIIVKGATVDVTLKMQEKPVDLSHVDIGNKNAWDKNFKLFKKNFLGTSDNAKQCIILNPKIIYFGTRKGLLLANADDFMIIENKRLGYRIHYLLKDFGYNSVEDIALYNGELSFEPMKGTDKQQQQWEANRVETYKGSFMHFLRSVYANNTFENGFITQPMYGYGKFKGWPYNDDLEQVITKDSPVRFDSLVTAIDTSFASFRFKNLFVTYDPQKAVRFQANKSKLVKKEKVGKKSSIVKLVTNQAIIDKKGSYTDYRDFYIHGRWAIDRVADQLPVDYRPPLNAIPHGEIFNNTLLSSLQKWTDSIPQEKAYLHMDKPYYATGDTIWFKGYVTTGSRHQLSAQSDAVQVDLINDQNQLVKAFKYPTNMGTVAGDIVLGDDIKAGSYRLRVYTQWMRNAGEDYFFDRTFTIGNPIATKNTKSVKPNLQQTDIQFFPESGNMVNDISSRIGFKATGTDGLGVAITGKIIDNNNNEVADFHTLHAGMSSFLLKPEAGKTYTASIMFADSTTKKVPLPAALNEGYALNVYQMNADSILVRIQASPSLRQSTVNLIVHTGGEVLFASQLSINGPITSIWLDKQSFPTGIAQFTIFNNNNEPLNERIAFIRNKDQMQLAISTPKPAYKSKEAVQLELDAKDSEGTPSSANFSVAVIDERKVPVDEAAESTILSNILLTSDLKGYVEKPNYYFITDTGQVNKALDNLMLTQGYRRFEWASLNNLVNTKPAFKAGGLAISGTVTNLNHELLKNATVMLVSTNMGFRKDTVTDADGRFKFENLMFPDSAKFAIQARTLQNSNNAIVTLDSIPSATITKKQNTADVTLLETYLQKAEQDGKPAKLADMQTLRQVNIKAVKAKPKQEIVPQGIFSLPDDASADRVYTIPDPEHYVDLKSYIQTNVSGVVVQTDNDGNTGLVDMRPAPISVSSVSRPQSVDNKIGVILNGMKTTFDRIEDIDLREVAKIEVVRTNYAMLHYLRGPMDKTAGFLLILTRPPSLSRKNYDPNVANLTAKGYSRTRRFYSPKYDHVDDAKPKPDLRTTIFWEPYINTDADGKTIIRYYNADGPGTYRVVIEGINAAGELGRQVYRYKVE